MYIQNQFAVFTITKTIHELSVPTTIHDCILKFYINKDLSEKHIVLKQIIVDQMCFISQRSWRAYRERERGCAEHGWIEIRFVAFGCRWLGLTLLHFLAPTLIRPQEARLSHSLFLTFGHLW